MRQPGAGPVEGRKAGGAVAAGGGDLLLLREGGEAEEGT